MTAPALPWRATPDGVELTVRLTPRAGTAGIDGIDLRDGRACLKVRVPAPPVEGAANAALVALIARALGVRPSAVTLLAGERARTKRLRIAGTGLEARLAKLALPG